MNFGAGTGHDFSKHETQASGFSSGSRRELDTATNKHSTQGTRPRVKAATSLAPGDPKLR